MGIFEAIVNEAENIGRIFTGKKPESSGIVEGTNDFLAQADRWIGDTPPAKHIQEQNAPVQRIKGAAFAPAVDALEPAHSKDELCFGTKGDKVHALQEKLGIAADGDFGPKTEAALKTFQLAHHMKATGVVDASTLAALNDVAPDTQQQQQHNSILPESTPQKEAKATQRTV